MSVIIILLNHILKPVSCFPFLCLNITPAGEMAIFLAFVTCILCSYPGAISVRLSSVPHWLRYLFSEMAAACGFIFAGIEILVICMHTAGNITVP
jgi:hypothetical protein